MAVLSSPCVKYELLFSFLCRTGIHEFIAGLLHVALHVLVPRVMMPA